MGSIPSSLRAMISAHPKKSKVLIAIILLYVSKRTGLLWKATLGGISLAEKAVMWQVRRHTRKVRREMLTGSMIEAGVADFEAEGSLRGLRSCFEAIELSFPTEKMQSDLSSVGREEREKAFRKFAKEVCGKLGATLAARALGDWMFFLCSVLGRREWLREGGLEARLAKLESEEGESKGKGEFSRPEGAEAVKAETITKELHRLADLVMTEVVKRLHEATRSQNFANFCDEIPLVKKMSLQDFFEALKPSIKGLFDPEVIHSSDPIVRLEVARKSGPLCFSKETPGYLSASFDRFLHGERAPSVIGEVLAGLGQLRSKSGNSSDDIGRTGELFLRALGSRATLKHLTQLFEYHLIRFHGKLLRLFWKLGNGNPNVFSQSTQKDFVTLSISLNSVISEELLDETVAKADEELITKKLRRAFSVLKANDIPFHPQSAPSDPPEKEDKTELLNSSLATFSPFDQNAQLALLLGVKEKLAKVLTRQDLKICARVLLVDQ